MMQDDAGWCWLMLDAVGTWSFAGAISERASSDTLLVILGTKFVLVLHGIGVEGVSVCSRFAVDPVVRPSACARGETFSF